MGGLRRVALHCFDKSDRMALQGRSAIKSLGPAVRAAAARTFKPQHALSWADGLASNAVTAELGRRHERHDDLRVGGRDEAEPLNRNDVVDGLPPARGSDMDGARMLVAGPVPCRFCDEPTRCEDN